MVAFDGTAVVDNKDGGCLMAATPFNGGVNFSMAVTMSNCKAEASQWGQR